MNQLYFIILCLLFSGCTNSELKKNKLNEWRISTMSPKYYTVRVDTLLIGSENQKKVWKGMVGKTTVFSSSPLDWSGGERFHSGYKIKSSDLPGSFYIRWHSLANEKTYNKNIELSEFVRENMGKYHEKRCGNNYNLYPYKNNILLGLAPDGMISVFLNGRCFDNELQFKVQAVEYKVADDFVYPELSEEAQAYVDEYGVPVGIW